MGTKTAVNEFVAYNNLGILQKAGKLQVRFYLKFFQQKLSTISAKISRYCHIRPLRFLEFLLNGNVN